MSRCTSQYHFYYTHVHLSPNLNEIFTYNRSTSQYHFYYTHVHPSPNLNEILYLPLSASHEAPEFLRVQSLQSDSPLVLGQPDVLLTFVNGASLSEINHVEHCGEVGLQRFYCR